MKEILIRMDQESWELIKSGKKTIEIRESKPSNMFYPFRVIVYVHGKKCVVGKFDVDAIAKSIRPESFVEGSCMTLKEILYRTDEKTICAWYIKSGSVVEYEIPFSLEESTGLKKPPISWCYLNRDVENVQA